MSATRLHDFLDEHGVDYRIHNHERAVTAERLAGAEGVTGWDVAKPVLLSIGGELAMLVLPAPVHVDLAKAADVLGHAQVRLADEDEFASVFADCEPGAEPPFGNLYDVPVFLDEKLRARHDMVCRDGSHTETVTLAVNDYVRVVEPEIVDVSTG
jgi:Ala-tRNA(Pro) deacylase